MRHAWSGRLGALCVVLWLCTPQVARAQEALEVPAPLKPWVPWVLYGTDPVQCAQSASGAWICGWPGRLEVKAAERRGDFSLQVWLDQEGLVRLPGDAKMWPQDVTDDGAPVVLIDQGGAPMVRLRAGAHRLQGFVSWPRPPQLLPIDPQTGEVALEVLGEAIAHPRLDAEGRLWLQNSAEGAADEADSIRVSVYRQIYDGVPLLIANRLDLNVSGRAREVSLGAVLLEGARPIDVRSDLPVQLSPEGELRVYVRPGSHTVTVETALTRSPEALKVPARGGDFFDPQEIWVWRPDAALRSVEPEGLAAVDPERTSLPEEWRGGTTFQADPGQALTLRETRRGEVETPPNVVRLHRTLWLDLDGRGYTVQDRLDGTMHQGWRLNYGEGARLGRVTRQGTDLLITRDAALDRQGVELRDANLSLEAELRLDEARGELSAVGWDHDVQSLSALLHLPPGWELLGGQGVDQMRGTWVESWTLFDFFFLLMVSLALGKLCGWRWAPLAALALCLSHGHGEAPRWVWIQLLASLALLRVLPEGWVRRGVLVYRGLLLVGLLVILAPYAREQVRFALHPQVAYGGGQPENNYVASLQNNDDSILQELTLARPEAAFDAAPSAPRMDEFKPMEADGEGFGGEEAEAKIAPGKLGSRSFKSKDSANWYAQKRAQLQQIDPNAVVQTGPGLPHWQWRQWELRWSGPVSSDHEVTLWLLSPALNRLATALRVALLIAMALLLIARGDMSWRKRDPRDPEGASGEPPSFWKHMLSKSAVLALAVSAAWVWSAPAQADSPPLQQQLNVQLGNGNDFGNIGPGSREVAPSEGVLGELRARLLEQERCDGPCVLASRADLVVRGQQLTMRAQVHAQRLSAWTLPGPSDPLRIIEVKVDGVPTRQLRREPGGLTLVRLPEGRHTVEVVGELVKRNVVTLQLGEQDRPHLVTFDGEGWSVDGLGEDGVPDSSLQLTRSGEGGPEVAPDAASAEVPPWYQVRRELALGLPWQIQTEVRRARTDRPQLVKLPLIEGEKVITDGVRVEQGMALVDFPRGEEVVSYTSELPVSPQIALKAPQEQPWTETWVVECSQMWRCEFSGLSPVFSVSSQQTYAPQWRPWPGESLKVEVNRPEGAPGQARTVEAVRYTVTPGKRLLEARLQLTVRASQGDWQKVTLPEGAELQSVTIGGEPRNIRPADGVVQLPLKPGKQEMELVWQQPWERSMWESLPEVKLDSAAVNAHLTLNLGDDRWLLWTSGPSWGPAVLYWSHLVVLVLIALLLGRLRATPLKTWEWLLLALGMAQLPVLALVPVVLWFVALSWRRWGASERPWWSFNLLQLVLLGLTLIALGTLYAAIHANLLFDPDMQVVGAGSSNHVLRWYTDQIDGQLPSAAILSTPLLVWRVGMLLWALWLVTRLLKWAPWGWRAFSHEGLWKPVTTRPPASPAPPASPQAPAAEAPSGAGDAA